MSIHHFRNTFSCPLKYCKSCNNKKKNCDECYEGYVLANKKCYLTDCEIYGECKYCTEYDCIHCKPGYKVQYGFCEESENEINKRSEMILSIGVIIIILITIMVSIILIVKKVKKNKKVISKSKEHQGKLYNNIFK